MVISMLYLCLIRGCCCFGGGVIFFFSSRRRHTRCALGTGFRRVLFRSHGEEPRRARAGGAGKDRHGGRLYRKHRGGESERSPRRHSRFRRPPVRPRRLARSEEHTSELPSLMRISYAAFRLTKKTKSKIHPHNPTTKH